ncbi:bacteriocin fulvocin C-related protein [Myxococcus landrumensis]|nr:bacteriocin fulvocin C-related protein [Myxococcus landrumus]
MMWTKSLLGALALGVLMAFFPTHAQAEEGCSEAQARIQAWVDANADRLPTTLEDVSRFPTEYRRAIQVALAPEQQVSLWKEHIRQYMSTHPRMNARQVAALEMVLAALQPQFYTTGASPALQRAQAAVGEAFSPEEARLIVATLGAPEAPGAEGSFAPLCECSQSSQYCGSFACRAYSCRQQASGCGFLGGYRCNGLCG